MNKENIYFGKQYAIATHIENMLRKATNYMPWLLFGIALSMLSINSYAAGGLDDATDAARVIQQWIYTIDFIGAAAYMSYLGFMWYLGRKDPGDFAVGIGMIAIIGGSIAGVTYAWSIWGTGGTL